MHMHSAICYGRVSVCLSVIGWYCIETAEWVELVFGTQSAFGIFLHCVLSEFGYLQNKYTFLGAFVPHSELRPFLRFFATSRRQSQCRPLSSTLSVHLRLQHCSRDASSATADTCFTSVDKWPCTHAARKCKQST